MSTKNLEHTVIEGGRISSNKWDRRYSHAETRAHEKAYLGEVKEDIENWYDYDIEPTRPVHKEFGDKLGPMYRWLERQVGKPWDEVRSSITTVFDTRTTAGRHIVYDHLLSSVEVTPRVKRYYYPDPEGNPLASHHKHDFYVDGEGILSQKRFVSRKKQNKVSPFNVKQIANWLSGRVVGKVGNKYFWFIPVGKAKKHKGMWRKEQWICQWGGHRAWNYNSGLRYLYLETTYLYKYDAGVMVYEEGKPVLLSTESKWVDGRPTFRQDRKLNDKEMNFWNTIPEYYQDRVLAWAPTTELEPKEHPYYKGCYPYY